MGIDLLAIIGDGVCDVNLSALSVRVVEVEDDALRSINILQRQGTAVAGALCRELAALEVHLIAVDLDLGHLNERQRLVLGLIVADTVDNHSVDLLSLVDGEGSRVGYGRAVSSAQLVALAGHGACLSTARAGVASTVECDADTHDRIVLRLSHVLVGHVEFGFLNPLVAIADDDALLRCRPDGYLTFLVDTDDTLNRLIQVGQLV